MNIYFDTESCRFKTELTESEIIETAKKARRPMSVILQITRRCQFDCAFCSEPESIEDPSLSQLEIMHRNIDGVDRVFLSGGEPLIRDDFSDVLSLFSNGKIIGVPTNAIASSSQLEIIKEKAAFVNIGLDGPRNITSKIRGDYDTIMEGIAQFNEANIPISITSVVLRSTAESILYTCQIADTIKARKVKFVLPVPKGNALDLPKEEFLTHDEVCPLFQSIRHQKEYCGWTPKITFTTWTPETEGYSVLIYPNGEVYAWPVLSQRDKVLRIGNVLHQTIDEIWDAYPYKVNHFRKYLGQNIFIC